MASQDARLSKFEAEFKQQQSEMTNKIDTVLKAITDRIARALPSDTAHFKEATISQTSLRQLKIEIDPQQPEEPEPTLEDEFQDLHLNLPLNIRLLEETDHIFGLADRTKSYPVGIVKDVEVHIGKLKLLNDFYVIDMKKDLETPLLVGRGFLATSNTIIDCKMAKIAVREGVTRSVFGVKGVDLGEEEATYWATLRKRESYKPRPHSDGIGARTPYYARKDFLDCHLPG
ncbi:MAK10-like protein [Tanacetum coccineum]|uniref:MAK10-like protein n=1 Tax=Tanacetum coccineum TaxID=301880 RepID=A0ABQ5BQE6_9ASTR